MLDAISDTLFWPRFNRFLILGTSHDEPLWCHGTWPKVAHILNRIFSFAPEEPSVHARVWDRITRKDVRFPHLSWDPKSFERWCFGSPETFATSKNWRFVSTLVFSPGLSVCETKHMLPTVFIDVQGKLEVEPYLAKWDQACHIVVRNSIYRSNTIAVEDCVRQVATLTREVMVLTTATRIQFLDEFDTMLSDFNYVGILETPLPELKKMKARWRIFT